MKASRKHLEPPGRHLEAARRHLQDSGRHLEAPGRPGSSPGGPQILIPCPGEGKKVDPWGLEASTTYLQQDSKLPRQQGCKLPGYKARVLAGKTAGRKT